MTSDGAHLPNIASPSIGPAWFSSLHRQLVVQVNRLSAKASRGDGRVISFAGDGSGNFTADPDSQDRLVSINGGYRLIDALHGVQETYNAIGQLTHMDRSTGQHLSLSYSDANTPFSVAPAPGYLVQVQDDYGCNLQFNYSLPSGGVAATDGRIGQIVDPAGQSISASYDAHGNLSQLNWTDTQARQFRYENGNFPWALTGVFDENNTRYFTIDYDIAGRANSSELAGGVDAYRISYASPPQILASEVYDPVANVIWRYHVWQMPDSTVVTRPNGSTSTLGAAAVVGYPRLTSQSQPAGAGCSASSNAIAYDGNGNAASVDDFNGSRVCSAYDQGRNLETSRVEGLTGGASGTDCGTVTPANAVLPTGSRKTSTVWHPDWRLAVQVAEPGRLTTSIYNGQPDPTAGGAVASCAPSGAVLPDGKPIAVLCKQVQQATTDTDGHLGFAAALQTGVASRVSNWTYNQYGQVLTERDPLGHTTTYAYYADSSFTGADPNAVGHTMGDLQTVTNAVGQATTYDLYDKNGNLLQSTDPNGVVTANSYDPRQRLLSTTVGGHKTSYTYDAVGQLLQVSQPDGSWIGYEYDAAHRKTATKDSLGNRIELTLDNAGNVTAQNVLDPSGALARTLSQSFDALNRVQQVSGAQ